MISKPKGNILALSVLLTAVSCAAGIWYELKPQVVSNLAYAIRSLFGSQMSLTDKAEIYHEDRTGQPRGTLLRLKPTNVPGVETIGGGDTL